MIENLSALRARFAASSPKLSSQFDEDDPRRLKHLSLERQKKHAEERLRDWKSVAGDTEPAPKLTDAQHAIAREQGFRNWTQLKAHIEQTQIARSALQSGDPGALDGGEQVLHIRCGHDIQYTLAVAGFAGDFLPFTDPYVHGPVPLSDTVEAFLHARASYMFRL